jgi:hypothetical protein
VNRPTAVPVKALGAAAREARRAARLLPGVRAIEAIAASAERLLLGELKHRFELLEGPSGETGTPLVATPAPGVDDPSPTAPLPTIAGTMTALLRRSLDDTPADSRGALHEALVRELVPDEARILAAVADGSAYPMVHIAEPGIGSYQKRVLENASSVGRAAGVALPARAHIYISHLRRLGLLESGPEDDSIRDEYEILLTEPTVRRVLDTINRGPRHARVIRRTIKISELGRELWESAQESQDDPASDRKEP